MLMNPAVTHLLQVLWGKVFEVLCFLDVQNEARYVFFFFKSLDILNLTFSNCQ